MKTTPLLAWLLLALSLTAARGAEEDVVDAIANRNPRPAIVRNKDAPGIVRRQAPLFAEDYDWAEQDRARQALAALYAGDIEKNWATVVAHCSDERYALTTDLDEEYVENHTVGDFCMDLVRTAVRSSLDKHTAFRGIAGKRMTVPTDIEDLAAWCKERRKLPLYELQAQFCEDGLKNLNKVKSWDEAKVREVKAALEEEIKKLRADRKPRLEEHNTAGLDVFTPEAAARYRKDIAKSRSK